MTHRVLASYGEVPVGWRGVVDRHSAPLNLVTPLIALVEDAWLFFNNSYNDQNQSYHPAKYLHVAMDMPTWVLRASVYTAPESIDSIVASSSLSLRSVRVINLSLFIINLSLFTIKIIS